MSAPLSAVNMCLITEERKMWVVLPKQHAVQFIDQRQVSEDTDQ